MKIAIDVTPFLPGGENGDIKQLLWELLKGFAAHAKSDTFILLTSYRNHTLFKEFEKYKMQGICVLKEPSGIYNYIKSRSRIYRAVERRLLRLFNKKSLLKKNGVSLLFCPFAAPTFSEPGIPTASIAADLQHIYYPFFFTKKELKNRNHFYERLRTKANYVISISGYTRKTIIEKLNYSPEKVYAIPVSIQTRLQEPGPALIQTVLEKYDLHNKKYCIYPANFWPHKNHKMLLLAFNLFQKKCPQFDLHLVLPGAKVKKDNILIDAVKQMKIEDRVYFPGYLPEEELSVIWQYSYFLIFPSLYEGFGIPLLDAMKYKKPILASSLTSIPEVAGDAAIYFDPKEPRQISASLQRIMEDKALYDSLVKKGQEQLKKYNFDKMVHQYIEIIHKAGKEGE